MDESAALSQWLELKTDSPFFKQWFRQSKVLDSLGRPMVVYHGTGSDIEDFDPLRFGAATDAGWFGKGFYFTPHPQEANQYAAHGAPNVIPVYLKIENPFDWRSEKGRGMNVATEDERYHVTREIMEDGHDGVFVYEETIALAEDHFLSDRQWESIIKHFMSSGFNTPLPREVVENGLRNNPRPIGDYIRYYGEEFARSMPTMRTLKEVVAFRPEQVKSAIGNSGLFDSNSCSLTDHHNRVMKHQVSEFQDRVRRQMKEESKLSSTQPAYHR